MEIIASLTEYTNKTKESFPMVQGLLPYLLFSRYAGFPVLLIAYERLKNRIETEDHTKLVLHDVEVDHRAVVEDVAQATDVIIEDNGENFAFKSTPLDVISIGLIAFLIDQVFSIFIRKLRYPWTGPNLMLFTSSGRDRNESLVINELSLKTTVVTSLRTTTWLRREYETDYEDNVSIRPLNSYSSFTTLYKQILKIMSLTNQSINNEWEIESGITKHLESDLGVKMPHTVHYACTEATSNAVQQVLSYYTIKQALNKEDPNKIIVRGDSPRPRCALAAAEEQDIDLYYLPHSVTCGYEVLPAQEQTTQFMPGPYEMNYLQRSALRYCLPNLVATGRPIHEEYRRQIKKDSLFDKETSIILVATQPFDDQTRKQFINVILNGLQYFPIKCEVLIKTHPSENSKFYESHIANQNKLNSVTIKSGPIGPYLKQADLTITINSNVGFESMIIGTPVISYNEWAPQLSIFPYLQSDAVPVTRENNEFEKLISDLDCDGLKQLNKSQKEFIESGYYFEGSIQRIKKCIESESSHS